jgi:hypothetical protein
MQEKADVTGLSSMDVQPEAMDSREETSAQAEDIARRAYERYQQRGGEHGRDQEDWFAAERELDSVRRHQRP